MFSKFYIAIIMGVLILSIQPSTYARGDLIKVLATLPNRTYSRLFNSHLNKELKRAVIFCKSQEVANLLDRGAYVNDYYDKSVRGKVYLLNRAVDSYHAARSATSTNAKTKWNSANYFYNWLKDFGAVEDSAVSSIATLIWSAVQRPLEVGLHAAPNPNDCLTTISILVEKGAVIDKDYLQRTIHRGPLELSEALLKNSRLNNISDYLKFVRNPETLELLFRHGADISHYYVLTDPRDLELHATLLAKTLGRAVGAVQRGDPATYLLLHLSELFHQLEDNHVEDFTIDQGIATFQAVLDHISTDQLLAKKDWEKVIQHLAELGKIELLDLLHKKGIPVKVSDQQAKGLIYRALKIKRPELIEYLKTYGVSSAELEQHLINFEEYCDIYHYLPKEEGVNLKKKIRDIFYAHCIGGEIFNIPRELVKIISEYEAYLGGRR